jgi:TPR repeat protein
MTWDGALSDAPGDDPWCSLDIAPSVRRLAEQAAAAAGLGVEEWLERAIHDACPETAAETPTPQPAAPTPGDPWLVELLAVTRRLPPLPTPPAEPEPDPFPTALDPSAPFEDASPATEIREAEDHEDGEDDGEPVPAIESPTPSDAKPMSDLVAKLWSEPEEPPRAESRRAEDVLQELEQQRLEWQGLLRLGPEEPEEKSPAKQEPAAMQLHPPRSGVIPPPPSYPAAAASDVAFAAADTRNKDIASAEPDAAAAPPEPVPVPWLLVTEGELAAVDEEPVARGRRPWRLLLAVVIVLSSLAAGVLTARYLLPGGVPAGSARQAKITLIPLPQRVPPQTETAAAEPAVTAGPQLPPLPSTAALARPSAAAAPPSAEAPEPSDADPHRVAAPLDAQAQSGDAKASYSLGILYALGRGVPKDYPRAARLFRAAAESGMPEAEYNIAVMYGDGMGVRRDVSQAIYWYRKAAAQGNANAAFNLGTAYANGTGVARNMATAAHWFRRAAGQGVVNAEYNLGLLYERGEGVRASRVEAYAWYVAAALQGDDGAARRRDHLAATLSTAQLTQAKTRAADLQLAISSPQQSADATH